MGKNSLSSFSFYLYNALVFYKNSGTQKSHSGLYEKTIKRLSPWEKGECLRIKDNLRNHYPLSINHQVYKLDLLVVDGADGHVVGSDIINKDRYHAISIVAVESEMPGCYHAIIDAITSLLGCAWCRATS